MKLLTTLLAAAALAFGQGAAAHSDDYLDSQPTPHGGQMRMAGAYHLELVIEASGLSLYVTDHAEQGVATTGASGTATVLAGGTKTVVKLQPAGDNRMQGSGSFAATPDMKVVVSLTLPGQPAVQARFTPRTNKQAAAETHGDDHHHH